MRTLRMTTLLEIPGADVLVVMSSNSITCPSCVATYRDHTSSATDLVRWFSTPFHNVSKRDETHGCSIGVRSNVGNGSNEVPPKNEKAYCFGGGWCCPTSANNRGKNSLA